MEHGLHVQAKQRVEVLLRREQEDRNHREAHCAERLLASLLHGSGRLDGIGQQQADDERAEADGDVANAKQGRPLLARQYGENQDSEEGARQRHHGSCHEHAGRATEALANAGRNLDGQRARRDAGRDDILIVFALRDELAVFYNFLLDDGNQRIAAAKANRADAQHAEP